MGLDKPVIEQNDGHLTDQEKIDKLLKTKPITRKVLDDVAWSSGDAEAWAQNVVDSHADQEKNASLNLYESHEKFVDHLGGISQSLGRVQEIEEMLTAVEAVEWQSLTGPLSHDVLTTATERLKTAKTQLENARQVTLRKLEGLMKFPPVGDAIMHEAEKELAAKKPVE